MKRDDVLLGGLESSRMLRIPTGAWRGAGGAILFVLIWILALYGETGMQMAGIWLRSGTFAHGAVVPLIVCWLIWRARAKLLAVTPRPSLWWLAPLGAVGFIWVAAQLAVIDVVSQLALTALLVMSFCAIGGTNAARQIAFPLGFLFFAVPIGEFLLPTLMQWTADFTVDALRLSGIPVYREGQEFVIPSGRWSVVEACSGIRYLIASLMIGTLYAYLSFRSLKRRLLFVGAAAVIPIIANWVRAYMIVMIGHLSNNTLAVGVDHLIYGWAFFGVVMLLMFWVGSHWREDAPGTDRIPAPPPTVAPSPKIGTFWSAAAAVALVTAIWPLLFHARERTEIATAPVLALPSNTGDWQARATRLSSWEPRLTNPSIVGHQSYRSGNREVGLYIGYYRDQAHDRKLVSSENTLVASGNKAWTKVAEGTREIDIAGRPVSTIFEELRGSNGQRLIAARWYWIDGRITSSDYLAKLYTLLSRFSGDGDDGAIIIAYAAKSDGEKDAIEAFLHDVGPALNAALERTRESR